MQQAPCTSQNEDRPFIYKKMFGGAGFGSDL